MKDFFNKETLDNIKQFCAENKKYVGVAGVLVGLILILIVVVAGGNNDRQSNTEAGSQTEISVKDFEFEKDYTNDAKDDISTLLADYYKAYVGDDLDTLGKLATPMSDNEKSYIGVVSQYYESVNDITPYTKNGLKKGTYFVSVKNSIKFTGVDTQAPTLDFFYIETGKDGKLFINNVYSNFNRTYCENELDDDIMELISKYTASSEFADLHEEVQKAYEQAVGSDANLKTMLETTLTGAIKQWYTSSGIANLMQTHRLQRQIHSRQMMHHKVVTSRPRMQMRARLQTSRLQMQMPDRPQTSRPRMLTQDRPQTNRPRIQMQPISRQLSSHRHRLSIR